MIENLQPLLEAADEVRSLIRVVEECQERNATLENMLAFSLLHAGGRVPFIAGVTAEQMNKALDSGRLRWAYDGSCVSLHEVSNGDLFTNPVSVERALEIIREES